MMEKIGDEPMFLPEEIKRTLETPCVVIDVETAKRNIVSMQKTADDCGCALRPHIKTHKMPYFAALQLRAGAEGICCAKVSEAEVMADTGIDDIFIAYPMVGEFRIKRAAALARRIRRLILSVDSREAADLLESCAAREQIHFEVRLEVDTGAGRTGAALEKVCELALYISTLEHLELTGIYTFKSLVLQSTPTTDNAAAAVEEGRLMAEAAQAVRQAGVELQDVSAGSTPTGKLVAATGCVNEIRPGTYIFNDFMMLQEKAARYEEIAARIFVTVVSVQDGYAVIDGGTKTFPMDIAPDTEPFHYPGYAVVEDDPGCCLLRMNEEHGMLSVPKGTELRVGDILTLLPIHVCTAVNMHNEVYLYDGGTLRKETVAARGRLV